MNEKITPWFGAWPPEPQGGELNMNEDDIKRGGKVAQLVLVIILLVGVIIVALNHLVIALLINGWSMVIDGIAIAFMTAAILGLTIDRFLKKQIVKDVFEASMGYILAPDLRGEVRTLYELEFICIEHNEIITFKPAPSPDLIILHRKMERTFKNITNKKQRLSPKITIVEWFLSDIQSKILDMGAAKGKERWNKYTLQVDDLINEVVGKLDTGEPSHSIELAPKETCTVWFETEEVKRATDVHCEYYGWPTINPRIIIRREHGAGLEGMLGILVRFGTERGKDIEVLGSDTRRFVGVLSPGVCVEIRWYRKKDLIRWKDGQTKTEEK